MIKKQLVVHWCSTSVKLLGCCIVLGLALTLMACNTVSGAGQDIQGAGESVESGADKVKEEIDKY